MLSKLLYIMYCLYLDRVICASDIFFASARLVDIVAEFVNILLGGMRRTRSRAFHTGRASCIQHPEGTRRCNPGPGRLSNTFIDSLELSEK